jgi:hypothetical protein
MLKKGEKKVGVGGRGKAKAPQGSKPSIKQVGKDGSVQQNKFLATLLKEAAQRKRTKKFCYGR